MEEVKEIADPREDILMCSICHCLPREAVESGCCHQLYCEMCLLSCQKMYESCPTCKQSNIPYVPSHLARRLIDQTPVPCPYDCSEPLTHAQLVSHSLTCKSRIFHCALPSCIFQGIYTAFLEHVSNMHPEDIIKSMSVEGKENVEDKEAKGKREEGWEKDKVNQEGRAVHLGITGKFYCGVKQKIKCECCNGYCGPNDGCNCSSCMKLDVKYRALGKGSLVNTAGAIASYDKGNYNFFCGRRVHKGSDKLCGLGNQCYDCTKLQNIRYIGIY